MPDWTRSMRQTYEFTTVDPNTWLDKKLIKDVEGCTITRDAEAETLGSATLTCAEDQTDEYVRSYLVTEQDGIHERFVLGTHLYQTPGSKYSATRKTADQDGYTCLLELKEKMPPLGYSIQEGANILNIAGQIIREQLRTPIAAGSSDDKLLSAFVSDTEDTWLTFLTDLISNADYEFGLDESGRALFAKRQSLAALRPVWIYTDDNSSILYPSLEIKRDLYGIPNVVEVVYSPSDDTAPMFARAVNDDPASPVSTVNRGREVTYRETNPDVTEGISQAQLEGYAKKLLRDMSSLEYQITYRHGYCPVNVGDCVLLNYELAGLKNVAAKVTRQVIKCTNGCPVDETAVFTKQLWGSVLS